MFYYTKSFLTHVNFFREENPERPDLGKPSIGALKFKIFYLTIC